jgi:hypothetical protein
VSCLTQTMPLRVRRGELVVANARRKNVENVLQAVDIVCRYYKIDLLSEGTLTFTEFLF